MLGGVGVRAEVRKAHGGLSPHGAVEKCYAENRIGLPDKWVRPPNLLTLKDLFCENALGRTTY
jgi:hypothetical protein